MQKSKPPLRLAPQPNPMQVVPAWSEAEVADFLILHDQVDPRYQWHYHPRYPLANILAPEGRWDRDHWLAWYQANPTQGGEEDERTYLQNPADNPVILTLVEGHGKILVGLPRVAVAWKHRLGTVPAIVGIRK